MSDTYENGMKVTYDPVSGRVIVAFRGRISVLPASFDSEIDAIQAGETHCRSLGWVPAPKENADRRFRSPW